MALPIPLSLRLRDSPNHSGGISSCNHHGGNLPRHNAIGANYSSVPNSRTWKNDHVSPDPNTIFDDYGTGATRRINAIMDVVERQVMAVGIDNLAVCCDEAAASDRYSANRMNARPMNP